MPLPSDGVPPGRPPKLSVLLPVHNEARFVAAAVTSVLSQSFGDLELIVVDDGSSDGSGGEVRRVADKRVRVVTREQPSGDLAVALGSGLEVARGELVARMDADDISYPGRFERQVRELEERPELVLVGTWADVLDGDGNHVMVSRPPADPVDVRFVLHYRCPFHHPSVMFRRAAVETVGGYRPGYRYAEDFDLWRRLMSVGEAANLPEVLLGQRFHSSSSSGRNADAQAEQSDRIGGENLARVLGRIVPAPVVRVLREQVGPSDHLRQAGRVLVELYRHMARERPGDRPGLRRVAAGEMTWMLRRSGSPAGAAPVWLMAAAVHPTVTARDARHHLLRPDRRGR